MRSPILGSVAHWLERLPVEVPADCDTLNGLLGPGIRSGGGAPIRFVALDAAPAEGYEAFIHRTGQVPTRHGNWHDFFNALAWLSFPRTKAELNRRHVEELARVRPARGVRGTPRDVLTLFDEGGVIVASTDARLCALLRGFAWKALFWERRAEVLRHMRFFVLGHAILEKAREPHKGVTAKALLLDVSGEFTGFALDEQLARADVLAAAWFSRPEALSATRNLAPLPVLGVPGWAEHQSADFYEDAQVFRPGYARARQGPP